MTICYGYICVYGFARNHLLMLLCCVLVTKNKRKKQDCGIQLSSPSRIIECRVLLAGCSYSLAMQSLVISYAPAINKNNKKRNATQRNGAGARKRLRFKRCIPSCCGAILHSTRSAGNRPLLGKPLQVFETRVDLESTKKTPVHQHHRCRCNRGSSW